MQTAERISKSHRATLLRFVFSNNLLIANVSGPAGLKMFGTEWWGYNRVLKPLKFSVIVQVRLAFPAPFLSLGLTHLSRGNAEILSRTSSQWLHSCSLPQQLRANGRKATFRLNTVPFQPIGRVLQIPLSRTR